MTEMAGMTEAELRKLAEERKAALARAQAARLQAESRRRSELTRRQQLSQGGAQDGASMNPDDLARRAAELRAERERRRSYGQANQSQNARQQLEQLEQSGDIRPAEQQALNELRASAPQDEREIGATEATYRGVRQDLTYDALDELAGLVRGPEVREDIRARDAAAREAYPKEFGRGEFAGAVMSSALPGLGWASATHKLPVLGRAFLGALVGGGAEGGRGFASGEGFQDRLENAREPAMWGAGFGAAAPLAARGAGAVASRVANRSRGTPDLSPRAVARVRQPVMDTQASMGDIQRYLDEIGEDAILADVPGPMQHQAMGLASMQGAGGAQLTRTVNQRAEGAGPRIRATMDENIDQPNAAFERSRALAAERTDSLGPEYEAAIRSSGAVEVRGVLNQLEQAARNAGPETAPVLRRFVEDLRTKAPNGLIDPAQLHWIRSDMSDAMSNLVGPSKSNALMRDALSKVDGVLDEIPGYAAARTGYANNRAMERALEDGQKALRGGRATASSPAEFQEQFSRLSDAQKDAFRAGLRRDIAGLMGTSRNDAAAAWGEFAKEWNEEKLRIALGDQAAEPIIGRLKAENVFSQTRGRVDAGSMTAQRSAARDALSPADPAPATGAGVFTAGVSDQIQRHVVDPFVFGPRRSRLNSELGKFYSAGGDDARRMLQGVLGQQMQGRGKKQIALMELMLESLLRGGGGGAAQSSISNP